MISKMKEAQALIEKVISNNKNDIEDIIKNIKLYLPKNTGEVKKFRAMLKTFQTLSKNSSTNPSIECVAIEIHGSSLFTVQHDGQSTSNRGGHCEIGDIMWLIVVNTSKGSFIRLNFMQNKIKNKRSRLSYRIDSNQLKVLTSPEIFPIKNKQSILGTLKKIGIEIADNTTGFQSSHLIASYGLLTDNDMLYMSADSVKKLTSGKTLNLTKIYQPHQKESFLSSPFCFHMRPNFYKECISIEDWVSYWRQSISFPYLCRVVRPYYLMPNSFHIFEYIDNIEDFIWNYFCFNIGEMFHGPNKITMGSIQALAENRGELDGGGIIIATIINDPKNGK